MAKTVRIKKPRYTNLAKRITADLHKVLGDEAIIKTEMSYKGHVNIYLISPLLNDMSERQKREFLWGTLREILDEQIRLVGIIWGWGANEPTPWWV